VFVFDLCVVFVVLFVFILFPRHKSRESMKIRPHPRGHPSSDDLESFPQRWRRAAGVRCPGRCALGAEKIGQEKGIWEAAILPGGSGG
jgi:hypothetical protein